MTIHYPLPSKSRPVYTKALPKSYQNFSPCDWCKPHSTSVHPAVLQTCWSPEKSFVYTLCIQMQSSKTSLSPIQDIVNPDPKTCRSCSCRNRKFTTLSKQISTQAVSIWLSSLKRNAQADKYLQKVYICKYHPAVPQRSLRIPRVLDVTRIRFKMFLQNSTT